MQITDFRSEIYILKVKYNRRVATFKNEGVWFDHSMWIFLENFLILSDPKINKKKKRSTAEHATILTRNHFPRPLRFMNVFLGVY